MSKEYIIKEILKKIKRYLFYKKGLTNKINVSDKKAIDLFFLDQKIKCDYNKKHFLIKLHLNRSNEVLNTRSFRRPRK